MRQLQTVLIALVALLGLAGAAEASVDLWTQPLFAGAGDGFRCEVRNVSPLNRAVRIRIYNAIAAVLVDDSFVVLPLTSEIAGVFGPGVFTCRFTLPSTTTVRAGGTIFTATGNLTDKVAVPAQ